VIHKKIILNYVNPERSLVLILEIIIM